MSVLVPAALGAAASAVLLRRPGSALRLRGLTAPARAAPGRRAMFAAVFPAVFAAPLRPSPGAYSDPEPPASSQPQG